MRRWTFIAEEILIHVFALPRLLPRPKCGNRKYTIGKKFEIHPTRGPRIRATCTNWNCDPETHSRHVRYLYPGMKRWTMPFPPTSRKDRGPESWIEEDEITEENEREEFESAPFPMLEEP